MPSTQEHRERASQNLRFAQLFELDSSPYLDWVVVGYFYAALHLVDALLYHVDKIDPSTHVARRQLVKDKPYLNGVRRQYFNLQDRSEDARYRLYPFTRSKIEKDVIPLYKAIEQHILPQLRPRTVA